MFGRQQVPLFWRGGGLARGGFFLSFGFVWIKTVFPEKEGRSKAACGSPSQAGRLR